MNHIRHCIVGRNFGSYVTHETKHFIYFYLGMRFSAVLVSLSLRIHIFLRIFFSLRPSRDLAVQVRLSRLNALIAPPLFFLVVHI
jgi:uncharacterized membrane protein